MATWQRPMQPRQGSGELEQKALVAFYGILNCPPVMCGVTMHQESPHPGQNHSPIHAGFALKDAAFSQASLTTAKLFHPAM